jgi:hypothetical protein
MASVVADILFGRHLTAVDRGGSQPSAIQASLAVTFTLIFGAGTVSAQGLPLPMTKTFSPSTVAVGGAATTTLTVTITNPNGFSVSGISFSDTYPAGLVPDQVGAYTCNAGSAVFTGSGFSLGNVTLGAGASCSVPILVHAAILGAIVNTTSQVTGTGVPPGGPASATLTVTGGTGLTSIEPEVIPAITTWGLILLAVLMLGAAIRTLPQRSQL